MGIHFRTGKTLSVKARLAFVLVYIILVTLFDSYFYGVVYQEKIKEVGYTNSVYSWVFEEKTENGIISVPRYRIIQKVVEIGGLIVIFYYCGLWCGVGILIAHYLLSFDLLFYFVLNKTYLFAEFEKLNNTYWLRYPYQAGYFLLQHFNAVRFYIMGFAGIAIALAFCFIHSGRK